MGRCTSNQRRDLVVIETFTAIHSAHTFHRLPKRIQECRFETDTGVVHDMEPEEDSSTANAVVEADTKLGGRQESRPSVAFLACGICSFRLQATFGHPASPWIIQNRRTYPL